jgi:hypothetical protein
MIASGVPHTLQTPYAGFNLTPNPYRLAFPCYLHTFSVGLVGHLVSLSRRSSVLHMLLEEHCGAGGKDLLKKAAARRLVALVNTEIEAAPAFPGMGLPNGGLSASRTTASAADTQLAVLPVCLLAIA